jgi:hypothetical protein
MTEHRKRRLRWLLASKPGSFASWIVFCFQGSHGALLYAICSTFRFPWYIDHIWLFPILNSVSFNGYVHKSTLFNYMFCSNLTNETYMYHRANWIEFLQLRLPPPPKKWFQTQALICVINSVRITPYWTSSCLRCSHIAFHREDHARGK